MSPARFSPLLLLALLSGCATAKLVGDRAFTPRDPQQQRIVVIEPLFEMADFRTTTVREDSSYGPTQPFYGSLLSTLTTVPGGFGSTPAIVEYKVDQKPFFAQPATLAEMHRRLLVEVQRRRPSWRVTSTGSAPALSGPVTVVRTVIEDSDLVASDRTAKNIVFAFGLVILPLQLINIDPVHETLRVIGLVERFGVDASALPARLVRYETQPDYAVNLADLPSLRRDFGLEVTYEEGLLADQRPRTDVLLDGFIDRLASATIALVEEP